MPRAPAPKSQTPTLVAALLGDLGFPAPPEDQHETLAQASAMHHESVREGSDAFESALLALATDYNIHAEPLASSVEIAVTRRQAEEVALQQADGSTANIDSLLVSATNTVYGKERSEGTLDLIISNRAVWLVLVPDQQVPIRGRKGPPFTYSATLAVLIDANSGAFLQAAALAT